VARRLGHARRQTGRQFDPEIVDQLGRLPQLVAALGFANAKAAGYEADDFLAASARAETAAGGSVLVVTSDRDAYQLVGNGVLVLERPRPAAGPPPGSTPRRW
jgi:DNA polymerase I